MGRPNVGKSTLFNRLVRQRRALATPVPGTTRDWIEGVCRWGDRAFRVIDTGGYEPGAGDIVAAVRGIVDRWAAEADAVLWLVDGLEGPTAADRSIARWLRARAKRVYVLVNKVDSPKQDAAPSEFYGLGFPDLMSVSASHGLRVNDLLDRLAEDIPARDAAAESTGEQARVAIVGRPNVGKSSILNRILGMDRAIVSDVPGTTRDTVDTRFEWDGKPFLLTDTAGLRAKKSHADDLENLTRMMAERALARCDVALLLVDAAQGILDGDTAVARLVDQTARACVVAVNKWDLIPGQERLDAARWFRERQPLDMPFLDHTPVIFVSARTGHNVPALLDAVWEAHRQFHRVYEAEELETFFWSAVQDRPYSSDGKKLVFRGVMQVAAAPPTFVIRTNLSLEDVHFSYQRYLENAFRKRFGALGAPVVFRFRRG
jgi:GTP-binding protein